MYRTLEELKEVNKINQYMIDFCKPHLDSNKKFIILSDERIKEIIKEGEEFDELEYDFPGEYEPVSIDIDYLLSIKDEIQSIKIKSKSIIETDLSRHYIVSADKFEDEYILKLHWGLVIKNENYEVVLDGESLITGLAATKLEEFDDDWGTTGQYLTISIRYEDKSKFLSAEEELSVINSFIFEVADTTGIALSFSEIRNRSNDFHEVTKNIEENGYYKLRDLEPNNEGMSFFVSAVQTNDPELKFLNFYKVLEHFSPIAINLEANELMRKKLDAPKRAFESGDYIRSIFTLANSMKSKFNDEDLIKASFNSCFDFIGLFEKLPFTIQKKVKSHLKIQSFNYELEQQKITTAANIAGKIIFKTRNKVVHAKSNFKPTGEEVDISEFKELNSFMKEASSQAIRWYSRQPEHSKLEIIK